ncbi:glucan endo-1,3-beta-glucosidase-like [Amaranthus tricolor]|uniref:glucan endo-1,3-beta-glucosidase-like n=1 Tax=Amaranthus tricolor TaxID=29722 RepID=UPI00258ACE0F|nr:glucan endo-1,3-beta-glucosidase-like [Amaranthus tricolor]
MGISSKTFALTTLLLFAVIMLHGLQITEAQIGVCYGKIGNNLPSDQDVVNLYKSQGIARMRLYSPDQSALEALKGSNIDIILDVPRDKLISLGSDPSAANDWVQNNIVPYASDVNIRYITVGNEIMPNDAEAGSVLPAMKNIQNALQSDKIKVSTAIRSDLVTGFPPSDGAFTSSSYMNPIVNFLTSNGSPLLANIYPYFSYLGSPTMQLNYALFTSTNAQVTDQNNGLQYQNVFDALVDTVYAALAKAGAPDTPIVVAESGWPSDGDSEATIENAGTYYSNLIGHVKQGTPLKQGQAIETYLFAMFDENQKTGAPAENHFGLFTPDQTPKYQLNFNN